MTRKTSEFMDMTEIYLKNLTADGKSANTAANYATTLASFISYIAENNRNPDVTGVMEWKAYLSESGNSTTTIRQRMRELNACFSWAVGSGLWDENPITKAIVPKSKKAQPYENLLTEEEFMLLLSEKRPRYFRKNHAARDRSIVILFITTALRNSELRLLCPADMDADAGTIKVKNGKGDKFRIVNYPDLAVVAIKEYLAAGIRPANLPDTAPLFGYEKNTAAGNVWTPFDRTALSQMIARYVKAVTGREGVRSHSLRHAAASYLISSGMNGKELQHLLGHSNMNTTQIYAELLRPNTAPAASANRIFAEMQYQTRRGKASLSGQA